MSERARQHLREVVDFHPRPRGASNRERLAPVTELSGGAPEAVVWRGDEEWISTLPNPRDASTADDIT